MDNWIDKLFDYYKKGTEGIKIIYICAISSLLYWIINFIAIKTFSFSIDSYLLLSAHSFLPFVWTILTFPFIHNNLWDLFFVMIMIYFTERIFRSYFNGESFLKYFVLGNLVGGIIFLIFSFLTGQTFIPLGGAVLGVYSTLFAVISYNPKMQITLFPLPLQLPLYVFGLVLIGLDFFSLFSLSQESGLFIARLGAAAFGFFYMKSFQKGNDFLGKWITDFSIIINKITSLFSRKSKPNLNIKKGGEQTTSYNKPLTDEEFNLNKFEKQKRIDQILDKISRSGYDNLTKEEKDFLFNSSK